MTRFELPTHPSNNGIPGYAYDPTMYTRPCPGFREGNVREGLGRGNALHISFWILYTLNGLIQMKDRRWGMMEGERGGHTVPSGLYLVPNPDE